MAFIHQTLHIPSSHLRFLLIIAISHEVFILIFFSIILLNMRTKFRRKTNPYQKKKKLHSHVNNIFGLFAFNGALQAFLEIGWFVWNLLIENGIVEIDTHYTLKCWWKICLQFVLQWIGHSFYRVYRKWGNFNHLLVIHSFANLSQISLVYIWKTKLKGLKRRPYYFGLVDIYSNLGPNFSPMKEKSEI